LAVAAKLEIISNRRPQTAWDRFRRNPSAIASALILATVILTAILAPHFSRYTYDTPTNDYGAPPSAAHWLGTNNTGYDLFTQLAVGGRVSLMVGFSVEAIILLVGVTVGLMAGYFGGRIDLYWMRFTDLMFAFPDILLAILIMAILGPSVMNIIITLSVTGWPSLARLVRGQALSIKERPYVEAARAIGLHHGAILWRHILPNLLAPIVVASTIDIAGVIIAESTLSFLGIGVKPPMPSWGSLISAPLQSLEYLSHPIAVIAPACALSLTVLSLNGLGDALRDALDPHN
jgi:ABC-type dipeptide/oligopeptide/nickel transport system permease subunit